MTKPAEIDQIYESLISLKDILPGDLQEVHAFIFDNKNPFAIRYQEFTKKFTDSRALY